jgi:sulfate adenylyltransferase subunit 1
MKKQTDILRIATAGSVDDGKSTLIGRLLYDTGSITRDKLESIESASKRKGLDFTDLSLLTDGLIAEREQGITIDVAHIYFSTPKRKYIIADSPGHVEYTRNMITGASNASVSLILVDARKGVLEQTRRHFYIASLLRIRHVVICVNKMDLVNYDESVFEKIKRELGELAQFAGFEGQDIHFIPMVARDGDMIVTRSGKMPWFKGSPLLQYLEELSIEHDHDDLAARFQVQFVIRPHSKPFHDFRGYAGRVASGKFRTGDQVTVYPSGRSSRISSIRFFDQEVGVAEERDSVVISLEDDIDISRGNLITSSDEPVAQVSSFIATICWMDETALALNRNYILQQGVHRVKTRVQEVISMLNIVGLKNSQEKKEFRLNDIGDVAIKLAQPIVADTYIANPSNGSFILIDEQTNNTVAVGFIR